jgi:hypothetical protein
MAAETERSRLSTGVTMTGEGSRCARLRHEIAAFVDLTSGSSLKAAATYTQLWLHLQVCSECAAIFLAALVLADAAARNELPPLPSCDRRSPQPL